MNIDNYNGESGYGNFKELRNTVCEAIENNKPHIMRLVSGESIHYQMHILPPDPENNIDFPSLVAFPVGVMNKRRDILHVNEHITLETGNNESTELSDRVTQAMGAVKNLASATSDVPSVIAVPILPTNGMNTSPYYQQLSVDCLADKDRSIDNQVISLIDKVKDMSERLYKKEFDDKVFLNGYSSSGVFAERFALLHPDRVDAACIGGAGHSIPVIDNTIEYPLGTKNIKAVSGHDFDMDSYSKIKFDYYTAGGELSVTSKDRINDNNQPACMYDMTYMDRSVPAETGKAYRQKYGDVLFDDSGSKMPKPGRADNCINNLESNGIQASHTIIPGYTHNGRNGLFADSNTLPGHYSAGTTHIKDFYNSLYKIDDQLIKEKAKIYFEIRDDDDYERDRRANRPHSSYDGPEI